MGYPKVAEVITDWPELAGSQLGKAILKLRHKTESGETVTSADDASLEQALRAEPEGAAQLLGLTLANALGGASGVRSGKNDILGSYKSVLGLITSAMASENTSFALRGFLHDSNCVSYWRLKWDSVPSWRSDESGYITPSGFELYLIAIEPTDETLQNFNEVIIRSDDHVLGREAEDTYKNPGISQVRSVRSHRVEISRLPMPEEEKPNPIFSAGPRTPRSFEYDIPFGAPYLLPLFESLVTTQAFRADIDTAVHKAALSAEALLNGDKGS